MDLGTRDPNNDGRALMRGLSPGQVGGRWAPGVVCPLGREFLEVGGLEMGRPGAQTALVEVGAAGVRSGAGTEEAPCRISPENLPAAGAGLLRAPQVE